MKFKFISADRLESDVDTYVNLVNCSVLYKPSVQFHRSEFEKICLYLAYSVFTELRQAICFGFPWVSLASGFLFLGSPSLTNGGIARPPTPVNTSFEEKTHQTPFFLEPH